MLFTLYRIFTICMRLLQHDKINVYSIMMKLVRFGTFQYIISGNIWLVHYPDTVTSQYYEQ